MLSTAARPPAGAIVETSGGRHGAPFGVALTSDAIDPGGDEGHDAALRGDRARSFAAENVRVRFAAESTETGPKQIAMMPYSCGNTEPRIQVARGTPPSSYGANSIASEKSTTILVRKVFLSCFVSIPSKNRSGTCVRRLRLRRIRKFPLFLPN